MKLLRVVANNFKLCEENFTISFVPTGNKTAADKEFELQEIADDLYVFSTLGIIGKNASGKTTVVELLSIIYDIFSNYRINNSKKIFKFIDNINCISDIRKDFYKKIIEIRYNIIKNNN